MGNKKGDDSRQKKSGCLGFFRLILFLLIVAFGALIYFAFDPQDLSDIEGYRSEKALPPKSSRDLAAVLKASHENGTPATITEKEVNTYLLRTLRAKQEGVLKDYVKMQGVWVRFEDGWGEVIIEREIDIDIEGKFKMERRHTVAIHFEIEQTIGEGGELVSGVNAVGHSDDLLNRLVSPNAGKLGKVPIVEGYLRLVNSSYHQLAELYPDLLDTIQLMLESGMRVRFEEGRMIFTPAPA